MRFLVYFGSKHENFDFRIAELQAISRIINGKEGEVTSTSDNSVSPFTWIDLPCEQAVHDLCTRATQIKAVFDVWAHEDSYGKLDHLLRTTVDSGHLAPLVLPTSFTSKGKSNITGDCEEECGREEPSTRAALPTIRPTFRFDVVAHGRALGSDGAQAVIDWLSFLVIDGDVRLRNPDVVITVLEDVRRTRSGATATVAENTYGLHNGQLYTGRLIDNTAVLRGGKAKESQVVEDDAKSILALRRLSFLSHHRVFVGRLVARGQRDLPARYALSKRAYIQTTSMDAELAFLAANQALVKKGSLVLDPFAGTGSLMIACAHFGAAVIGGDIDWQVVRGSCPGQDMRLNFQQYGLHKEFVDQVIGDNANAPWRSHRPFLDAVVTDPPWGLREGARRIGRAERQTSVQPQTERASDRTAVPTLCVPSLSRGDSASTNTIAALDRETEETEIVGLLPNVVISNCCDSISSLTPLRPRVSYPQKRPYLIKDMFCDLLDLAATLLVLGGRLVYWLPVYRESSPTVRDLPAHPQLKLISYSEQPLNRLLSRWMITMEKSVEIGNREDNAERLHLQGVEMAINARLQNTPKGLAIVPAGYLNTHARLREKIYSKDKRVQNSKWRKKSDNIR